MAGLADHGIIRSYDTIVELRKYAEKYKRIPDLRISAVAFEAPFQGSPLTREEFGVLNQLALTIETINHANKCLDNMQLEQALVVHWAKDEAVKATSERHMRTLATVLAQCETQLSALQPYATSAAWYMPTT